MFWTKLGTFGGNCLIRVRHLKGIEKYWNEDINVAEIVRIPKEKGNLNLKVAAGSIVAFTVLITSAVTYWAASYFW